MNMQMSFFVLLCQQTFEIDTLFVCYKLYVLCIEMMNVKCKGNKKQQRNH